MSNSSLICKTVLAPNENKWGKRTLYGYSEIPSKITIHHTAGTLSLEEYLNGFANPKRGASANYVIGNDGRIGLCVPEDEGAGTSSNQDNDLQAVTIEVANEKYGEPWKISEAAMNALIDLCADICIRNGIKQLVFTGDHYGNLTMHRYFASTACPGTYLASKFQWIAETVNTLIKEYEPMTNEEKKKFNELVKQVETLSKSVDAAKEKYNWTTACPKYAQSTVQKLLDKGYLKGADDGQLHLSEQMLRQFVILDRAGIFE